MLFELAQIAPISAVDDRSAVIQLIERIIQPMSPKNIFKCDGRIGAVSFESKATAIQIQKIQPNAKRLRRYDSLL